MCLRSDFDGSCELEEDISGRVCLNVSVNGRLLNAAHDRGCVKWRRGVQKCSNAERHITPT